MVAKKKPQASKKTKTVASQKTTPALKKKPAATKVSSAYTKSELLNTLAERTNLSRKEVNFVLEELVEIMGAHLKKGSPEEFKFFGLFKMGVRKVAAKKARKGVNPFTGEATVFKAKPASRKVRIIALKKLKEMID